MADVPTLGELLPVEPEELLTRGALGVPGRLRIEVGLDEPRFAPPQGQPTSKGELALRRALGGVSYPADRERLLAEAGRWLDGHDELRLRLSGLPELIYGGELEVLRRLDELAEVDVTEVADQGADEGPISAGEGNEEGSSANR
ncbi:MAG: hypothetical protein WBA31_06845 [Candidatus Dormiibacterota bacterium]